MYCSYLANCVKNHKLIHTGQRLVVVERQTVPVPASMAAGKPKLERKPYENLDHAHACYGRCGWKRPHYGRTTAARTKCPIHFPLQPLAAASQQEARASIRAPA